MKLTYQTMLGRLLRLPLRALPHGLIVRVPWGLNSGFRWIADSATHGCWLGLYEKEKSRLFQRMIEPGDVVFDIGANVGYYSLLASRAVGKSGRVCAFEPLPGNLNYLRRHISINNIQNITVFPYALSDHSGSARFVEGKNNSAGKLDEPNLINSIRRSHYHAIPICAVVGSALPMMSLPGIKTEALLSTNPCMILLETVRELFPSHMS